MVELKEELEGLSHGEGEQECVQEILLHHEMEGEYGFPFSQSGFQNFSKSKMQMNGPLPFAEKRIEST